MPGYSSNGAVNGTRLSQACHMLDALPDSEPTASKHHDQLSISDAADSNYKMTLDTVQYTQRYVTTEITSDVTMNK